MRACLSWTQIAWLHLLSGVAVECESPECKMFLVLCCVSQVLGRHGGHSCVLLNYNTKHVI